MVCKVVLFAIFGVETSLTVLFKPWIDYIITNRDNRTDISRITHICDRIAGQHRTENAVLQILKILLWLNLYKCNFALYTSSHLRQVTCNISTYYLCALLIFLIYFKNNNNLIIIWEIFIIYLICPHIRPYIIHHRLLIAMITTTPILIKLYIYWINKVTCFHKFFYYYYYYYS